MGDFTNKHGDLNGFHRKNYEDFNANGRSDGTGEVVEELDDNRDMAGALCW
jgi:hypothetical protein